MYTLCICVMLGQSCCVNVACHKLPMLEPADRPALCYTLQ